jgi:lipoprotein-anchoring transpeptidase ErfK/SrfK
MSSRFAATASLAALMAALSLGAARAAPVDTDDAAPAPRAMAQPYQAQFPVSQYQEPQPEDQPFQDRLYRDQAIRPYRDQTDQNRQAAPDEDAQLDPRFQRKIVSYPTPEAPGTIIIDTPHTYLYLVLGNGQAIRYGIGVGREGFTWSGVEHIARKAEWPDWYPPPEMIKRQPYLPRMMAGGPGNPLGARAMYLGHTEYRIHGTNDPSSIGKDVSSGCIHLTNEDVEDLYRRVQVGAKVVVLPQARNVVAGAEALPATSPAPPESADAAPSGRQQAGNRISQAGLY